MNPEDITPKDIDRIKEMAGKVHDIVLGLANELFEALNAARDRPSWDDPNWMFHDNEDVVEVLLEAGDGMKIAMEREDFDVWCANIATAIAVMPSTIGRSKWDAFPAVARMSWRASRDAWKQQINSDIDDFLNDLFEN